MNFMDVLNKRRAVREYTQATIDPPEIEALINAAIEAPSAMNLQPWAFAVVLGQERIDGYAKRAKDWLLASFAQSPEQAHARHMLEDPHFTLFYHAPALVLVLAKSPEAQAVEDCCLAAENLMLAARDRGLGTCWIGFARPWLNLPETKAELDLPDQYQVVAPIVLGRPMAWPESHGRRPAEIHWIRPAQAEQHPAAMAV
ncbi:MAG: nitroreductase family protein [Candidatus Angelobacter sp.]